MNSAILSKQREHLLTKYKDKTVLVAGATGLIGSRIVFFLLDLNDRLDAGIKIVCLYRNEEKKKSLFLNQLRREDINFVYYDINSDIQYGEKIDYIFNCAGISGGTKMHLKDPMAVYETAYKGTKGLLDLAVRNDCDNFLYVSTYEIYGETTGEGLILENALCDLDTMKLRNIYPESKRMCESMCVAYSSKYGINITVGRLTSTFGNGVKYDDPRFFAEFARCVIEERDIVLKSSGATVRSYLDSDDAATAFLYIAADGENCNIYNVTNMDNSISIRDIAQKIIDISETKVQLKFDIAEDVSKLGFRKEGCTLMDASKLYALGWGPVYTFEDTLRKLIKSMKDTK